MKASYIGILTPGSTSRMRAEVLRDLTPGWAWTWVDTDIPMRQQSRLWRTAAFRFNSGRAVREINALVQSEIADRTLDMVWVDKAVFLRQSTVRVLRRAAGRLVHFTPDTAFHANRSRHFEKTLPMFDLVVTTKSFEVDEYRTRIPDSRIVLVTQGFDPKLHYPRFRPAEKIREASFAGLAEPDREQVVAALLDHGVPVRLAGEGWSRFLQRWGTHPKLAFAGAAVFGDDYARLLSGSWVGLGLLSKRFPELHTTRTFEIPACESILATESTKETKSFFAQDEALFFHDGAALARRLSDLFSKSSEADLARMAIAGRDRVLNDCRDYPSILKEVLAHAAISA